MTASTQTRTVTIEVHYTAQVTETDFARLLAKAEEVGCGHKNPGKVETVRRLLISDGVDSHEETIHERIRITRAK